jgi:hypothetical protein
LAEEDRYTFAGFISLLMQCEDKLSEFYEASAQRAENMKLKSLFHNLSKENLEQKAKMEKARRETVIEMALEPMAGLRLKERLDQIDAITKGNNMGSIEKAIALEKTLQSLYKEASFKIMNLSAETAELLTRFSEKSTEREVMLAHNL